MSRVNLSRLSLPFFTSHLEKKGTSLSGLIISLPGLVLSPESLSENSDKS
eukprot:m.30261 g.30261  ORF g.30261 m.30261 type:complete len:50 (+) comp31325_c0_seq7:1841-1990(+)